MVVVSVGVGNVDLEGAGAMHSREALAGGGGHRAVAALDRVGVPRGLNQEGLRYTLSIESLLLGLQKWWGRRCSLIVHCQE